MAKIRSGILGPVSGSIGGIVGAKWKGIPTIRSKPLSVANPNTSAQQTQRGKFSQVVAVARLLLSDLIQTYWDPFAREMSGYNAFVRQNINAFDSDGLAIPADFFSARGTLVGLSSFGAIASASNDNIDCDWADNTGEGDALADDYFCAVWYNSVQKYWMFQETTATRGDGAVIFLDPKMVAGDELHIYPFFSRPDITRISDSILKTVTVS